MKNTYLFIIWHKALWQRNNIINDINKSFEIVKDIYIEWHKHSFSNNLKAFYGRKLGDPIGKMISSGTKPFELIIVKDANPNNIAKETYENVSIINTNIYNKKQLYRLWTAGSHRIHSSDNENETLHDLAVLFGSDYESILASHNNSDIVKLDTKGLNGFDSINDLKDSLNMFGNNIIVDKDDYHIIFCKCRYDVVNFLKCKKIINNEYSLTINNNTIRLYIFGELDGDLLNNTYDDLLDSNIRNAIVNNFDNYISFKRKNIEVNRKETFYNRYVVIKNEIKLLLKKLSS